MVGDEDGRADGAAARERTGATTALRRDPVEASGRPIDAAARARIGRGLRLHYAEVLALPVPDRLRTLLDTLAARSETEAQS